MNKILFSELKYFLNSKGVKIYNDIESDIFFSGINSLDLASN